MGNNDHSVFIADNFEGITNQFSNFSLYRTTTLNRLVKAQRYGQWWLLKCLRKEVEDQPLYQEMLRKEFEVMIQLQHPNIVRTYSMERVEPYGMCIVMEWVEGETLEDFLSKQGDRQVRIKIIKEIVDAIGYMHQKYNPQNEMFRKNKTKRSAPQNEMFLFRVPSPQRKTPQISLGRFLFLHVVSNIQIKFHILVAVKQLACAFLVVLVYVYVAKVQRYAFQRQIYLPSHEVEMVNVSRQAKVRVAASLVC